MGAKTWYDGADRTKRGAALALAFVIAFAGGAASARAATTTVDCENFQSLELAVIDAAPGDTLVISGTCRTHNLTIDKDLTLQGTGDRPGIDGGGSSDPGVLIIPGRTVGINGLRVAGGRTVGIQNVGTLFLRNSVVEKNTGWGGLQNQGRATLVDSVIRNNWANNAQNGGGGIFDEGLSLTVLRSTIASNRSYTSGGGIYTEGGDVLIENSTITGNVADGSLGEGSFTQGAPLAMGGGLFSNAQNILIESSTISGNSAIPYRTRDKSVGGIWARAREVTSRSSLIAGNTDQSGGIDCVGNLRSRGYTLLGGTNSCDYTAGPGDVVRADPQLGALRDNGGPTPTLEPRPGSPAIDAIPFAGCTTDSDQRGVRRPQGNGCDFGAVEVSRIGAERRCEITGTQRNDVLRGTPGDDVICGLAGRDTVIGRGGDDILRGMDGDDRLRGEGGDDHSFGGRGHDACTDNRGENLFTGC